ncbi:MAG: ATP-binding cassette domain-containing protein, partial [Anaerolineales bacterium]|nr:ATP-binding cassette domain-containing protein [Anaerolineales bacterium]
MVRKNWWKLAPQKSIQSETGNGRSDKLNPVLPPSSHLIDLRQVVKTYHSSAGDFTALKGIDLTAEAGEFLAIIGKSGSGKSTL